jgi:serine/threonine protein kinase
MKTTEGVGAIEIRKSRPVSTQMDTARSIDSVRSQPLSAFPPKNSHVLKLEHSDYDSMEQVPFKALRVLGHGSFGIVEEVEFSHPTSRQLFARKLVRIPASSSKPSVLSMLQNEVDIMKRLSHLHIVQVQCTYTVDRDFAVILKPVADLNLEDYLACSPYPPTDTPIRRWFGCLASGLAYMHAQKVKHKDIKPANILVKGIDVLFTDFGIARDFHSELTTAETGMVTSKTPMYCAPEVAHPTYSRSAAYSLRWLRSSSGNPAPL